ncbi:hypothetical protein [Bdellovibrio bacteriovorus]|uniref:hypothetical protein n=1 Tax=Bdellovibrio TaxID=958 RepID=UPI0035A9567F
MIRTMLFTSFLVLGLFSFANAAENLYSCKIEDAWLQKQKLSGSVNVSDLDHAEIQIVSSSETVTCPLAVESVQDNSLGKVSEVVFKLLPEACTPFEKSFNRNLRKRITLNVSTQPGTPAPAAQIAWRNRTGYSDCKEILNNLKDHGIGTRFPQSQEQKKESQLKGTK